MMVCAGTFGHTVPNAAHFMPPAPFHGTGHILCVATQRTHTHIHINTYRHTNNALTYTFHHLRSLSCLSHSVFTSFWWLIARSWHVGLSGPLIFRTARFNLRKFLPPLAGARLVWKSNFRVPDLWKSCGPTAKKSHSKEMLLSERCVLFGADGGRRCRVLL